jgi:phosphoenolpyruvate carboxykinase (ATP)
MLGDRMQKHNVPCYLVNTGWVGGAYGRGQRMSLPYTRALVNAVVGGQLDSIPTVPHAVFEVGVPVGCPGVPAEILDARGQWPDGAAYDRAARDLLNRFRKNYEKFEAAVVAH